MTSDAATTVFDPTPSLRRVAAVQIGIAPVAPTSAGAVGYLVAQGGDVPSALGLDRTTLEAAGFDAAGGSSLVVPTTDGPTKVAVGIGGDTVDDTTVRNAAAAAQRYRRDARLGTIISLMLPYPIIVLVAWVGFYVAWYLLGIPMGPGYATKL